MAWDLCCLCIRSLPRSVRPRSSSRLWCEVGKTTTLLLRRKLLHTPAWGCPPRTRDSVMPSAMSHAHEQSPLLFKHAPTVGQLISSYVSPTPTLYKLTKLKPPEPSPALRQLSNSGDPLVDPHPALLALTMDHTASPPGCHHEARPRLLPGSLCWCLSTLAHTSCPHLACISGLEMQRGGWQSSVSVLDSLCPDC